MCTGAYMNCSFLFPWKSAALSPLLTKPHPLGWSSISLSVPAPIETVWQVQQNWTQPFGGQKSCETTWCMPWHRTWGSCARTEGAAAMQGSWLCCPFFPSYQYLLVYSHRSLKNIWEVWVKVIRLQLLCLQEYLQWE